MLCFAGLIAEFLCQGWLVVDFLSIDCIQACGHTLELEGAGQLGYEQYIVPKPCDDMAQKTIQFHQHVKREWTELTSQAGMVPLTKNGFEGEDDLRDEAVAEELLLTRLWEAGTFP